MDEGAVAPDVAAGKHQDARFVVVAAGQASAAGQTHRPYKEGDGDDHRRLDAPSHHLPHTPIAGHECPATECN